MEFRVRLTGRNSIFSHTGETMKKLLLMMCAFGLFAFSAIAQGPANYAGTWKLDKANSKLDQRMMVDSMTWTVSQAGKELKIVSEVKRAEPTIERPAGGPPPVAAPPEGAAPMRGGRGMGRGGFGGGGGGTTVYSLDGKETIGEAEGPMGKMPVTYKAAFGSDGTLVLTNSRSFNGPMGEITLTTKETWKLSPDGKTLTVERENTSPRGAQTSTLVFAKS
jgi:hypothetical protein